MNNFHPNKPIYLQVVEEVKLKILCEELHPGDKLESVREMASRLAVNPNTIQRAFLELERQGFIVTQRAVGRFVSEDEEFLEKMKQQRIRDTVEQFVEEMARYGVKPKELIAYFIEQEDKYERTHNNTESE